MELCVTSDQPIPCKPANVGKQRSRTTRKRGKRK